MTTSRRHAVAALTVAGLLWGSTVPLSRLALEWLGPGWLTAARFAPRALGVQASEVRLALRQLDQETARKRDAASESITN